MILVSNNIVLSPTSLTDADVLIELLKDKEISDNTLVIPYPYNIEDAKTWLEDNDIFTEENGFSRNYAIRDKKGEMIGVIGLQYNYGLEADKSEFGYWLGKPYWKQGIMTVVINKFCEIAKEQFKLKQLEAHVFVFNLTSQRLLLKTGFAQHETITGKYKKEGKKIDAVKFVKVL
jgi:ribosomal-protein-alanine N-acetyltransferase